MGLIVYVKLELAGPIYSDVDVAPFRSEKDSYGLFSVDGWPVCSSDTF